MQQNHLLPCWFIIPIDKAVKVKPERSLMAESSSVDKLDVKNSDFQFVTCEHAGLNGGDVYRPESG